jgi:hypothetical protein
MSEVDLTKRAAHAKDKIELVLNVNSVDDLVRCDIQVSDPASAADRMQFVPRVANHAKRLLQHLTDSPAASMMAAFSE